MTDPLAPGSRFGEFEILERAGEGGMGVVYRAHQASLNRTVALKVISPAVADAEDFRIRFGHESQLAASIEHPNVVSVYNAGEVDGQPYIAMQWINGADLQSLLRGGPLEQGRAATIIGQIARALDAAHSSGLLHRDVKPGNVLVRPLADGDHAYLTDFGLAKLQGSDSMTALTKTGYYIGTTGYLAPEQIRGEGASPRSDLYSLGCVLYETLTGARPFDRANEMAVAWAHANDARPRPSEALPGLSPAWDEVVGTAMAIDPERRYGSGAELAAAASVAANRPSKPDTAPAPAPTLGAPPTVAGAPPPPSAPPAAPPAPPAAPPPPPLAPGPDDAAGSPQSDPTRVETPTPTLAGSGRREPRAPAGQPAPAPARDGARTTRLVLLVALGVLAAAGIAVGAIAASGGFSSSTQPSVATTATTATTGTQSQAPTGANDREQVLGVLRTYQVAFTQHNLGTLGSVMTSGVFRHGLRAGGCSDITGRDAVLAAYAEEFGQVSGTYNLTDLNPDAVRVNGSTAQIDTGYTISSGSSGSISFTLVKAGSVWRIDRIVASCG